MDRTLTEWAETMTSASWDTPPDPRSRTPELLHLYCIIEAGAPVLRLLEERRVPGLEPMEPLFPIQSAGLVAAVSRVPSEFSQENSLNELLKDLSRLAPFALRHDLAIRALLDSSSSLIPATLGAIYYGPQGIERLLEERGNEFRILLDKLAGKQEWGLKVFRDEARSLEATRVASDQLAQLAEKVASARPGRAYLLRKQENRVLSREAEEALDRSLTDIFRRLSRVSDEASVDEIPSAPSGSPTLVLKAAFLVRTAEVGRFHSTVGELESAYQPEGLHLEPDGPWAPYSFVRESGVRAPGPQEKGPTSQGDAK